MVLTLCACKSSEVKAVEEQINELGAIERIALTDGPAIKAASDAYLALSDKDQQNVENYATLENAEKEYNDLVSLSLSLSKEIICSIAGLYMDSYVVSYVDYEQMLNDGTISQDQADELFAMLNSFWGRGLSTEDNTLSDVLEGLNMILEVQPDNEYALLLVELCGKADTYRELAVTIYTSGSVPSDAEEIIDDYKTNFSDLQSQLSALEAAA